MCPEVDAVLTRCEKIPTHVFDHADQVTTAVAGQIAAMIRAKAVEGKRCVLGLATGSTPVGVYDELVRLHRQEGLSLKNVITFNLDEYYPMQAEQLQSYRRFMQEYLFDLVDIDPANIHIPDGTVPRDQVRRHCAEYEKQIAEVGGIDLQLLGIGRTGHIGFNEPGSGRDSRTRLITLDGITRRDAASDFFGLDNVPRTALTMGVGSILDAKRVVLIAFGEHKAPVIAQAVEGPINVTIAASYLQEHPDAQIFLDRAAGSELTRYKAPWLLELVKWTEPMIRKAVIWLARKLQKPILKLTDEDYIEAGLQDLLTARGPVQNINVDVFRNLQVTITGWPGGKRADIKRPGDLRRATDDIHPKRVLIFSPHPDDDVISMGGTLIRLVDQGHDVHVAYQTSGGIAVFDADAIRFADFAMELTRAFNFAVPDVQQLEEHVEQFLKNKTPGQVDSDEIQRIKALIRRGEARAAGRYCGLPLEHLHFLDMPFYETGRVRKKPLGEADMRLSVDLLEKIQPHQIYAAGDLSDPHGTHRVCLAAVFQALKCVEKQPWYAQCEVYLYRGAWQEWEPEDIDMAVPLSPQELMRKRNAIFKHESQKDKALFPGLDEREFWQRAEQRNRGTAQLYDRLGLAEYEAIEGFVRWRAVGAAPSAASVAHTPLTY